MADPREQATPRLAWCKPSFGHAVWVRFEDGSEGLLYLAGLVLRQPTGAFRLLKSKEAFAAVEVGDEGRCLRWSVGVYIAAEDFYDDVAERGRDAGIAVGPEAEEDRAIWRAHRVERAQAEWAQHRTDPEFQRFLQASTTKPKRRRRG